MTRVASIAIAFLGLLVVAAVYLWASKPTPSSPPPVNPLALADRAVLQALAVEACECKHDAKRSDCGVAYDAASKPFRKPEETAWATACAPISTSGETLMDAGGEFKIVLGYNINEGDIQDRHLCREADAQAAEQAFNSALGPAPDFSKPIDEAARKARYNAAKRALERTVADIRSGRKLTLANNHRGCT